MPAHMASSPGAIRFSSHAVDSTKQAATQPSGMRTLPWLTAATTRGRWRLAHFFGSNALAYAGEAERAINWAQRALRISPFDRLNYTAYNGLAIAHFLRGSYDEAEHAARRAVQSNPSFSVSHSLLAAALARLERIGEAEA